MTCIVHIEKFTYNIIHLGGASIPFSSLTGNNLIVYLSSFQSHIFLFNTAPFGFSYLSSMIYILHEIFYFIYIYTLTHFSLCWEVRIGVQPILTPQDFDFWYRYGLSLSAFHTSILDTYVHHTSSVTSVGRWELGFAFCSQLRFLVSIYLEFVPIGFPYLSYLLALVILFSPHITSHFTYDLFNSRSTNTYTTHSEHITVTYPIIT